MATSTKSRKTAKSKGGNGNGKARSFLGAREVPNLPAEDAQQVISLLQERLYSLIDLQLTLKHVHWNVVGPNFIAVHEMLDPQVVSVRAMTDAVAERIATCGGQPVGTPGSTVEGRSWEEYALGRARTEKHLEALDSVYAGVIADHRRAVDELGDIDPVSEDLMIAQLAELELFAWFVRSHLGS
ncbi:MAG: DNA starvation/stationary phase protection protein [Acidimicrobiales bacterium]|jgi:starvation-inducible DNA-binding protein|nr:DNA starvation/stationary phase protection protein [Acidimicrobiales bacterium]